VEELVEHKQTLQIPQELVELVVLVTVVLEEQELLDQIPMAVEVEELVFMQLEKMPLVLTAVQAEKAAEVAVELVRMEQLVAQAVTEEMVYYIYTIRIKYDN
jgi:hypothetical protein